MTLRTQDTPVRTQATPPHAQETPHAQEMPLRVYDTPLHAHASAIQLVPIVCPVFVDHADWSRQRSALVANGALHREEAALADSLPLPRRSTFVAGRHAMRSALQRVTTVGEASSGAIPPILATPRGAPRLPDQLTGSISHKRELAIAAVTPRHGTLRYLGVDLEARPTAADLQRPSIASRILTPVEYERLHAANHDALAVREYTRVAFALKEAVYKAIDPIVQRYVGFTEVELDLAVEASAGEESAVDGTGIGGMTTGVTTGVTAGTTAVHLRVAELRDADITVTAHWYLDGPWIVAAAFTYGA